MRGLPMAKNEKNKAMNYLKEYLEYYDRKSILCKRWYTFFIVIDIVFSAFIPFTALFFDVFNSTQYVVAFMGSIVTIASTLSATFCFHENWIDFRTSSEILKYHKYLYETTSPPYTGKDKEKLLIETVKNIFVHENKAWRSHKLNNRKAIIQIHQKI